MAQIFALYVVYQDGRTLLQKDFNVEGMEADLVTGFLSAVSMFLSDLVGRISEEEKRLRSLEREEGQLRIIDREDVKILLEFGKNIYVAVFATDDLLAIRHRMRSLLNLFEVRHGEILENWSGDLKPFRDMVPEIDGLFRPFAISERYVPQRVISVHVGAAPEALKPMLNEVDGERSLDELAADLGLPLIKVILDVLALERRGAVRLERWVAVEQLVSTTNT